jgi:hypothetical protein
MTQCVSILLNEGVRDGWLWELTDEDIRRILARYKEHISFWNAAVTLIEADLRAFAGAVNRDYWLIVNEFNSLQPRRFPVER